jgi:FkbM family methyltransferase
MKVPTIPRRFLDRFRFWMKILKHGKGTNPKVQLGLILSSIIDTLTYSIYPLLALSPKIYASGIVYFKNYGVYFYVRKSSDDLYNIMPGREGDVNTLILKSLSEGDVFIDVGANVGYYSILAGKIVGERGQVIALEPVPNTVKVLDLNIKLNNLKNIKTIPKAAWSNSSLLNIYLPRGYYGWASPVKWHGSNFFTVNAMSLDDVSKKISAIKLLKIDVEGSEYQVLMGAKETLEKTKHIVIEVSENLDKIQRILREAEFQIQELKFTKYIHAFKN